MSHDALFCWVSCLITRNPLTPASYHIRLKQEFLHRLFSNNTLYITTQIIFIMKSNQVLHFLWTKSFSIVHLQIIYSINPGKYFIVREVFIFQSHVRALQYALIHVYMIFKLMTFTIISVWSWQFNHTVAQYTRHRINVRCNGGWEQLANYVILITSQWLECGY